MRPTRKIMALLAIMCLSLNAWAQFDDSYDVEEWTLDPEEEEAPTPKPQAEWRELCIEKILPGFEVPPRPQPPAR